MNTGVHIIVRGLVQGVGFRYFVARHADRYNLRGYAKNLYNGDVEIVAEGERGSIEMLIKEVKVGPRSAQVSDCVIEWTACGNTFKGFEVR
jgi:acylphosphatase